MSLLYKVNNPDAAVTKLLKSLSVNIDGETISAELDKHPDYPSLLAISDVLTTLDIENTAFRVEYENLRIVTCPFIAHTNINGGDFIVVNKMDGKGLIVSSDKWNRHKIKTEEFKKIFEGIVLTAEPSATLTTTTTSATFTTRMKYPAVIIGSLFIMVLTLVFHTSYFTHLSWQLLTLTLIKSAGLIGSVLLLIQSIDSNNPLVQILCQTKGKTDCNAILSSKAAKVPIAIGIDGLSWSEVGFFYFAGTWLLLLFDGGSTAIWQVLAVLNFISLPYTVYSIYYQARVAKQWCVLCCAVQAILWLEFIPLLSTSLSLERAGVRRYLARAGLGHTAR